jgi:hypothetical protein
MLVIHKTIMNNNIILLPHLLCPQLHRYPIAPQRFLYGRSDLLDVAMFFHSVTKVNLTIYYYYTGHEYLNSVTLIITSIKYSRIISYPSQTIKSHPPLSSSANNCYYCRCYLSQNNTRISSSLKQHIYDLFMTLLSSTRQCSCTICLYIMIIHNIILSEKLSDNVSGKFGKPHTKVCMHNCVVLPPPQCSLSYSTNSIGS